MHKVQPASFVDLSYREKEADAQGEVPYPDGSMLPWEKLLVE